LMRCVRKCCESHRPTEPGSAPGRVAASLAQAQLSSALADESIRQALMDVLAKAANPINLP